MKRIICGSTGYANEITETHAGVKYSIKTTEVDNSPEADPFKLFQDFKGQVSEIHPYDDADYAWATFATGVVKYYRGSKLVDKSYYGDANDFEAETNEWCQLVVDNVIDNLQDLNKNVKSIMIHN